MYKQPVGRLAELAAAAAVCACIALSASAEEAMNREAEISYVRGYVTLPDGGRLAYYVREGPGAALVLIPGSWGDYRVFDRLVPALDPDLRVVIVELRGHGGSWPPASEATIEGFAEDVLRVTEHLGLERFYVGGHSIGGMVPIEVAGRRPGAVAGAIAIEGWTHHEVQREAFESRPPRPLTPEQEAIRLANRARVQDRLSDEQIREFASAWRKWDGLPILETTPAPILEIWGDRGHPTPDRALMRIPDRPNIGIVWIAGASHALLIEKPGETARAINQFIASVESSSSLRAVPAQLPDPAHMFAEPALAIGPDEVDFSGLPRLEPELITIFRASQPGAGFNMHPYIAHFAGRFWAMWSSNRVRDLQAGQHVRYATSPDGVNWSDAKMMMDREDEANMRYFARGFWVRNDELYALAAYDEAVRPLFGPGLELLGYLWNEAQGGWNPPIVIADDTINNFPPRPLPSGVWMMSRRDHGMDKSMLRGGVSAATEWQAVPIAEPADGARLDEPMWWTLPNGTVSAAFRDGNRSRRLYRAFSTDDGLTWTPPVQTDFPDATAKFNVLRLSNGTYAMASNPNTSGVRIPICLSLSSDGVVFDRMAVLRDAPTIYRYDGKDPGYAGYHYPQLLEHGGYLYIIHAENMEDIILMRVPIEALER